VNVDVFEANHVRPPAVGDSPNSNCHTLTENRLQDYSRNLVRMDAFTIYLIVKARTFPSFTLSMASDSSSTPFKVSCQRKTWPPLFFIAPR